VFVVLIAGALGVRKILIRLWRGPGEAEALVVQEPDNDARATVPAKPLAGKGAEKGALPAPSKPGTEVPPPPAAKLPGRKLPRILLVGPDKEMLPSLAEALKVATPGDTIEIRTNGPLIESGAELRFKEKPKDTPLVIRAGRGFQPVLAGRRGGSLMGLTPYSRGGPHDLVLANVDVTLTGLHFAGASLDTYQSSVTLDRCTCSRARLDVSNSQGPDEPLKILVDRCFMRDSTINSRGASIRVTVRESGFASENYVSAPVVFLFSFDSREDQALDIQQSTFVNVSMVHFDARDKWPRRPLSFRMDRSVFGVLWPIFQPPPFVELLVPPGSISERGMPGANDAFRETFGEFRGRDNFANYRDPWALVADARAGRLFSIKRESVILDFPQNDQTLRFGKRLELARSLFLQKGQGQKEQLLAALSLPGRALPEDLVVSSTGPMAERMKQGIRYGCDVTQLPVPPPATLATLEPLLPTPGPLPTLAPPKAGK
jgi:hypothetical protein